MTELLLDDIESELFKIGLDCVRDYDTYDEHDYIRIIGGTQHLNLYPLWSQPSTSDEDTYFLDSDDVRAKLYRDGEVDCEVDLFPESALELAELVERIFDEGVDFLS